VHGGVSWQGRASLPLACSVASTAPRATALPCLPGMAKVELRHRNHISPYGRMIAATVFHIFRYAVGIYTSRVTLRGE